MKKTSSGNSTILFVNRIATTLAFLALTFAVFYCFSPVFVTYKHGYVYHRRNLNRCFAQQHLVRGAIEMCELDKGVVVKTLNPGFCERLGTLGYLTDWDRQADRHLLVFGLIGEGDDRTLFCPVHGCRSDFGTTVSPRAQLEARGIRSGELYERTSTKPFPEKGAVVSGLAFDSFGEFIVFPPILLCFIGMTVSPKDSLRRLMLALLCITASSTFALDLAVRLRLF